jgi:hypothetical protein
LPASRLAASGIGFRPLVMAQPKNAAGFCGRARERKPWGLLFGF